MSGNMFSASSYWQGQKPQRRIGRRSLALNNTTNNTTLNGTINNTAKFTSEFPPKRTFINNEPSCASTPLPDHSKNKENIFLSSIKPVLPSSPKSVRKAPYQRRIGRRSMAAAQTSQLEEASLNESVTRMRNINSSLKSTDPKTTSKTAALQPQATGGGLSFLNLEKLEFLKRYFPSSVPSVVPQVVVDPPSPIKSVSDEYLRKTIHTTSPAKASESHESLIRRGVQTTGGQSPARTKLDYDAILKQINSTSPARSEAKYGSLLKNLRPKYESIRETSESPTLILQSEKENGGQETVEENGGQEIVGENGGQEIVGENGGPEIVGENGGPEIVCENGEGEDSVNVIEEEVTFLKKSLNSGHVTETMDMDPESQYGSFLGDTVSEGQDIRDKEQDNMGLEAVEGMKEPKVLTAGEEHDGDQLNRTFELDEEESFLFKTPLAPKYFHLDNSNVTYKTPKRFQLNDDGNDSFVENERTITLQFRSEPPAVNNVKATTETNMSEATSASEVTTPQQCDVTSTVQKSLPDFVAEQRTQLEGFVAEQNKQMREFLDAQNVAFREFLANIIEDNVTKKTNKPLQKSEISNSVRNEQANTMVADNSETTNTTVDSTSSKTLTTNETQVVGEEESVPKNKTPRRITPCPASRTTRSSSSTKARSSCNPNVSTLNKSKSTTLNRSTMSALNASKMSALDESHIPHFESKMSSTIMDDEEETITIRPRQSMAFSNFKKNCSILKTPSRTRSSFANSTAVMTPGTLSTCVRDQLEALEYD